jgi:hypothetical protein
MVQVAPMLKTIRSQDLQVLVASFQQGIFIRQHMLDADALLRQ